MAEWLKRTTQVRVEKSAWVRIPHPVILAGLKKLKCSLCIFQLLPRPEMFSSFHFPSRFAVFRGPYHNKLRTELVDSIMIYDTTPSADDTFYTATIRSNLLAGTIVGNDNQPDKTVRSVKIHSPLRADHYGRPFSPSNERFVVLPFELEVYINTIPIFIKVLAFESTNWMPRYEGLSHLIQKINGESFKYHYQHIYYVASILMKQATSASSRWLQCIADPYSVMNHPDIRSIPCAHISPRNVHRLREETIEDIYYQSVHNLAMDLAIAAVEAEDDYSASFDASVSQVAPPAEPMETDVEEAAKKARLATLEYTRLRKELKMKRDQSVPVFRGMWIKKPTADGRDVEPSVPGLATIDDVREGIDDCPWPYQVYKNHVKTEIEKGTQCPITMEPLSACKVLNVSMNCGHIYSTAAITQWTNMTGAENSMCPTCRTPIAGMWQMTVKSCI